MTSRRRRARFGAAVGLAVLAACDPPAPEPLPPDSFAFGVFGDGPYYGWEQGRFRRLLEDVGRADVEWLIHVGDLLWHPCTEAAYGARRAQLDSVGYAVVYTPGDNEWTDCHEARPGGYEPLGRLAVLRRVFFDEPSRSLGGRPLALVSQAGDTAFAGFPENARWEHGGFVFTTVHVVGSSNGLDAFDGRTEAHDREVERRTAAALAWLDEAFAVARRDSAAGVVIALHAAMGLTPDVPTHGFEPVLARLATRAASFPGPVLLVHGDDHELTVDHPLRAADGTTLDNFTRLQTYGSPDIGWVRVMVDTVAHTFSFEPRRMRGWW